MPFGGLLSAGIGAAGSLIGGIAGNAAGAGARGEANNRRNDANAMIQELQNAPEQARPLILEKYRQAGLLTPEMESEVSAGLSKMEGVKTDGLGVEAQKAALKQMQERAATGMTATDRAALAKAQSDANVEGRAKQEQIMQQFAQRGQGGMGAQLAAQLAEQQGGANRASQNALDIMGKSQQQALQAAAQSGQMGSTYEKQQFGQQSAKAQAADEMNRFNTQLRAGTQQRNVGATNQAQAGNLQNLQGLQNQNTQNANQELLRQRQGEQQDFLNRTNLANMKANAMTGQANQLQAQGDQAAAGQQALFGGLGKTLGGLAGQFGSKSSSPQMAGENSANSQKDLFVAYNGGQTPTNFKGGGYVPGQAKHEGDHPENDTVEAVLSPGEIVVPRSIAQTSLGDKLLDLLKSHHEIKTHLDGLDKKASKPKKQKMADGGMTQPMVQEPQFDEQGYPLGTSPAAKEMMSPQEVIKRNQQRDFINRSRQNQINPAQQDPSLAEQVSGQFQQIQDRNNERMVGMSNGGQVPQKGTPEYLQYLMSQLHGKKNYADGTVDELGGVVPQQLELPFDDSAIIRQTPDSDKDIVNTFESEIPVMPENNISRKPASMDESEGPDMALEEQNDSSEDLEPSQLSESQMSKSESDESKPMIKKSSKEFDSSSDALKRAQDERLKHSYLQQMEEGAAIAGSGISRTDPSAMISAIRQQKDRGDLPVKSFSEQVANKSDDPNSNMSKVVRDYIISKGMKVPENASAADLFKIAPFLQKDSALLAAIKKAELAKESKESEGEKNRQNRLEAARIAAEGQGKRQAGANDRQDQRLAGQVVSKINNDPIIKPSMQNMASLQKSKAILGNKSVPLTPQLLADAEQDVSSALTLRGIGATEGKIKRTELNTIGRRIAEAKQKYLNSPNVDLRKTDPELVKVISKMVDALHDDYDVTIKQRKKDLASEFIPMAENSPKLKKTIEQYTSGDKVVVEKDGKKFNLPKSQLEDAIKQGYTQVQ